MSKHEATITWKCGAPDDFRAGRFSREHAWTFDGGLTVPASASPAVVRPPMSNPANIDPEEAFVASLSSCHMLWFLDIAARAGWCVDRYADAATGVMRRNEAGKVAMTMVILHPSVEFSGERLPDRVEIERLHHEAHESCFIANSVKTEVRCEPVIADPAGG
jgi:organic hydroperoxide reductase OsmC/OhrA